MVGAIGLYVNQMHHRAEITYDLSRDYWRQGITRKAILRVMAFAFDAMELSRIEAVTRHENVASSAVLKSAGFAFEGTLKNYRYYDDKAWDVEMYAATEK